MAFNVPLFLVATFDKSVGHCKWGWPESWMAAAYNIVWIVLLAIIPLIVMTGLYSKVVQTLWFKPNDGNDLDFQRRVRFTKSAVAKVACDTVLDSQM